MALLVLRSSDRVDKETTSTHDCRLHLSQPLENGRYKLVSAVLPQTVPTLAAGVNNRLAYRVGPDLLTQRVCVLRTGIYTINSLLIGLNDGLIGTTASFDDVTGKLIFTPDADSRVEIIAGGAESMCPAIGFTSTASSENLGDAVEGRGLVDLVGATRSTQILLENGEGGMILDSEGRNSTFVLLPDTNSYSQYHYSEKTGADQYWDVRNRRRFIDAKILDAKFAPLNLQGADWLIVLRKVC
jgi:hypothetical protein